MCCEQLSFYAPADRASVRVIVRSEAVKWHEYGDTRWPTADAWVEIDAGDDGVAAKLGALVMRKEIPADVPDPIAWIAENTPLAWIFPEERSDAAKLQRLSGLRQQAVSTSETDGDGPRDSTPRYVQSYCLYRNPSDVKWVASYTDLLNADGIVIPRYRMARAQTSDFELCRFMLHSLFRLNEARFAGLSMYSVPQLDELTPVYVEDDEIPPEWTQFHPMRVLRTRPQVRALPSPSRLTDGVMDFETLEKVSEVRRCEMNLHNLAFSLDARRPVQTALDTNATLAAYLHRANGGAIYSLPARLVEEFDQTDCDEVLLNDLRLPFPNLFLRFDPPSELELDDGAFVDGCYVVKQGDELLFTLTSRWAGVAYDRSLSVVCLDPTFSLHLPIPTDNPSITVNEAVALGIQDFLAENAPPTDNFSQPITRPDGTTTFVEDVRAESRKRRIELFRGQEPVFRACLNIVVNALCFISFRPEDVTEEWDHEPP